MSDIRSWSCALLQSASVDGRVNGQNPKSLDDDMRESGARLMVRPINAQKGRFGLKIATSRKRTLQTAQPHLTDGDATQFTGCRAQLPGK